MLFLKECKKVWFSALFVIYLLVIFLDAKTQNVLDFRTQKIEEPLPDGNYGMKTAEIPEQIMPAALESLWLDYCSNSYVAYPIGFYKVIRLNEKKRKEMAQILEKLTGEPDGSFDMDGKKEEVVPGTRNVPALRKDITYEEFRELMGRADRLIGGGSNYDPETLSSFCYVPVTYEEACAQYRLTVETDHFTGGYARLFCDYMVVFLSVLPVFLAVSLSLKDSRARADALLYTRKISGAKLMITRYLAVLAAAFLPVLLLCYLTNATAWGLYPGEKLDYLAPLKYVVFWVLPTIMTAASVGMFLTELTGTPAAVLVQGLWWIYDMNQGMSEGNGPVLWRLIPRHNSMVRTQDWTDHLDRFLANRLFFTSLSLVLLIITTAVYERKRRGALHVGKKSRKKFFSVAADRGQKQQA